MTQTAAIFSRVGTLRIELPSSNVEVMPGVRWGAVDAFPTPAYWAYQVVYRRILGEPTQYKLGRTLAEEVGACLLGGHGMPASVGLAAYDRLRSFGAFEGAAPSESQLLDWLTQPMLVGGRNIRYRFPAQKSRYLAGALEAIQALPTARTGRTLRDWLRELPGIGYKTASWVARNWLGADDVAILDIHILRFGQAIRLFPTDLSVERNYLDLEKLFLEFSSRLNVRPSELDAIIWHEMATSPRAVQHLVRELQGAPQKSAQPRLPQQTSLQMPLLA